MNNTVLIKAKGNNAVILFIRLSEIYPHAHWQTPKTKWWQSEPRHELRIQNVPSEEIESLRASLHQYWPLGSSVTLEVF